MLSSFCIVCLTDKKIIDYKEFRGINETENIIL